MTLAGKRTGPPSSVASDIEKGSYAHMRARAHTHTCVCMLTHMDVPKTFFSFTHGNSHFSLGSQPAMENLVSLRSGLTVVVKSVA